ncbi:hypothetical protein [Streptomyces lincolnensis]|uniref:hypothetical protein n=1 Tax=Streptomyces lincolnensis TaxID=1915 RepID=UPI00082F657E|nr:hypothetical protein [Streptomyces lincolnensis]QMV08291.1 hypothetical protein GJU35_23355 [Streptomyces lincolnensis]
MSKASFVDDALIGVAGIDDVDSYVDAWHDEDDTDLELHEWLGMTWDEYRLWVEKPSTLRYIVAAHRHGRTVSEELIKSSKGLALAARADSADEVEGVLTWLQKTGRL